MGGRRPTPPSVRPRPTICPPPRDTPPLSTPRPGATTSALSADRAMGKGKAAATALAAEVGVRLALFAAFL